MSFHETPYEHVSLVLHEKPSGRLSWVRAQRANADAFGWTKEFDTEVEHRAKKSPTGLIQFSKKSVRQKLGGNKMMLGFSSDHYRPAAQTRFSFRVSSNATLLDCAELAHFTEGDWKWMTTPDGVKRTREEWASFYAAGR